MTDNEIAAFIKLVEDMRETQKKYFKATMSFEKRPLLQRSKELEKEVDRAIKNYSDVDKGIQKALF